MGCSESKTVETSPQAASKQATVLAPEDAGKNGMLQREGSYIEHTPNHEDIMLDRFDYAKLDVEVLDNFMADVEKSVNAVVDTSNGLNEVVVAAQDQIAIALGTFRVEVDVNLRGPPPHVVYDRDSVLLRLEKASDADKESYPQPAEVHALCANPSVAAAFEKFDASLTVLFAFMDRHNPVVMHDDDNLQCSIPAAQEVEAFNEALSELRAALGADYRVALEVRPAGARNCRGVRVQLVKPAFKDRSEKEEYVRCTFLDVAKTSEAKHIYLTQSKVDEACGAVAKAMQAVPSDLYKFTPSHHHLMLELKPEGPDPNPEAVAEALKGLKRAVATANAQISKLRRQALRASGDATVGKGVVELFNQIVAAQAQQLDADEHEAMKTIKFDPHVKSQNENMSLELPIEVTTKDGEVLERMQLVSQRLLPAKGQLLYKAIMSINEAAMDIAPCFARLQTQVKDSIKKADEVFRQPEVDIKAAFPSMEATGVDQLVKLAERNLQAVKGSAGILESFLNQVQSLSTEFDTSCKTIKQRFQAQT